MKITKLHLKNYQQFKDLTLDFTHPETGEPLKKVCFIGRNGTGKTTILDRLSEIIEHIETKSSFRFVFLNKKNTTYSKGYHLNFEFKEGNNTIAIDSQDGQIGFLRFTESIHYLKTCESFNLYSNTDTDRHRVNDIISHFPSYRQIVTDLDDLQKIKSRVNSLSYIKGENPIFDQTIPTSTVNEALALFDNFPIVNKISNATVNDFWKMLIYHIKKNESDRYDFENTEENFDRTKRDLVQEFDSKNPNIKEELRELWDNILISAQLYFDSKVKNPIQLNDNLKAYIKRITDNEKIPYNKLSTGIKNFIFQLGHVFAIHFNREIDNAFLLADEPAQGLFPDFIYDLVEMYEKVVGEDTQIFMATHNPIIASQFEPYERFILDFDEEGYVNVRRGTAPIGDDPNDILYKDFKVHSVMPKQGEKEYKRYRELKQRIQDLKAKNPQNGEAEKLGELYDEAAKLRLKYDF